MQRLRLAMRGRSKNREVHGQVTDQPTNATQYNGKKARPKPDGPFCSRHAPRWQRSNILFILAMALLRVAFRASASRGEGISFL
jgi:hypothetical protein